MQTLGLVHKNIHPDNVLVVFQGDELVFDGSTTPQIFLLGWERARQVDDNHMNRTVVVLKVECGIDWGAGAVAGAVAGAAKQHLRKHFRAK